MPDRPFHSLHAIVDVEVATRAGWEPLALAEAYAAGGARLIQVRAKTLGSAALLALCSAVVQRTRSLGVAVVVNDRADVAKLAGAAGVHVGQDDLPPADARLILGPDAIIGYSTHSLDQARHALAEPISYLAIGPVFLTTTKDTGYASVGLDLVTDVAREAGACPVVAIGGITLDRVQSVCAAGASAVAVIGDLLATAAPTDRVRDYVRQLTGHRV